MRYTPYHDRREAGEALARELGRFADQPDVIVLALPRGGVPVGFEVARALHLPMDVFVVRKLGVPSQPELAMGAIASGGVHVLNDDVIKSIRISEETLDRVTLLEAEELRRREHAYREDRPPIQVKGFRVILVDDGLATGSSMRAAIVALCALHPSRIIVAVPVGALETCDELRHEVDELICILSPKYFGAVVAYYDNFEQIDDEQVSHFLRRAKILQSK